MSQLVRPGFADGPGQSVICLGCGKRFQVVGDVRRGDRVPCPYCGHEHSPEDDG